MKIATLGSRIIDDAVINSKAPKHNDNIKRIVGISLFSINSDSLFGEDEHFDINENNEYRRNIFLIDFKKSVTDILSAIGYDKLFIDFAASAERLWQCRLTDGRTFRCTYSDIFRNNITYIRDIIISKSHCQIADETIINPLEWNDSELSAEISRLSAKLSVLDHKRTVLFNPYIPFRYKIDNSINSSAFPQKVSDINAFSAKCFNKLHSILKCSVINRTDFVLGGSMYAKVGGLSYTEEYYDYLNECINSAQSDKLEKNYIRRLQASVEMCSLKKDASIINKLCGSRKLILICESDAVYNYAKEDLGIPCSSYIKYSDAVSKSWNLCYHLAKLRNKADKYFIVIAHLTHDDSLLKSLWENGYTQPYELYVPTVQELYLNNFTGEFYDIYHNRCTIKSANVRLHFYGHASEVTISEKGTFYGGLNLIVRSQSSIFFGKNIRTDKMNAACADCATITIDDFSTFADNCNIMPGTPFINVHIGKDCMFSSKVFCLGGDGHAIFDINTQSRINLNPHNLADDKFNITVGNHVWVGYQAFLMTGTKIGNGTIIGARTLVNRHIPNNVIAAGKPASIIKKDVVWNRDPFTHNIYDNPDVIDAEYIKRTGVDI